MRVRPVITPLVGLTMAVAPFIAQALSSRWWLAHYRYGLLEWLWRSITHVQWQPWRVAPSPATDAEPVLPLLSLALQTVAPLVVPQTL